MTVNKLRKTLTNLVLLYDIFHESDEVKSCTQLN